MKKSKKFLSIVLSIALVAGISVGATLALLSKQSEVVKNTFVATAGLIEDFTAYEKDLDEQDEYGNWKVTDEWVAVAGQEYGDIMPGTTVEKEVAIDTGSTTFDADAYVFAKVADTTDIFEEGPDYTGWIDITSEVSGLPTGTQLFVYGDGSAASVDKGEALAYVPLFDATGDNALQVIDFDEDSLPGGDITVTFYACQTATFADAATAWNAVWGE